MEVIGDVRAERVKISDDALRLIGDFTRENVLKWYTNLLETKTYGFDGLGMLPIEDFHAVCGNIDIPWAKEEYKAEWAKFEETCKSNGVVFETTQ